MKTNVGAINFLNCLPLSNYIDKIGYNDDISFFKNVPSQLAANLLNGSLDISPVSSIFYATNSDKYLVIPNVCVSANGNVKSIILVSKKPISELNNKLISLSKMSLTSHCLLKIILKKLYKVTPTYEIRDVDVSNPFIGGESAVLLIGDDALFSFYNRDDRYFYYDLGRLWKELTGMCMTYAVWVVNKEFYDTRVADFVKAYVHIYRGLHANNSYIENLIRDISKTSFFSYAELKDYLGIINWHFGIEQINALKKFYSLAHEIGLIMPVKRINFANISE